ncbi:uncharacterized protein BKA55DRAFT_581024 [Fusarium redolens]|uniref:Uncharacterized protein n=1 Tax=Fusarium redolens TaxID=48865 RepID=A0A9P9JPM2_FUSRE|nr:uncharacterized protein BKA55DRAFT_581024 [Fusarium redolens]KAH7232363.1 hypothetical protein BKA55DRAFT_581024 [Fusarium redolens]
MPNRENFIPTRLIYVGPSGLAARLVTSCHADYLALSHSWGAIRSCEFKTTQSNFQRRLSRFSITETATNISRCHSGSLMAWKTVSLD